MSSHKIRFVANPMQKAFIEHRPFPGFERPSDWPANEECRVVDLFDSRMGEGKSAGLVWSIYFHTKYNPGARWIVIRDTWENLRDTTLVEFLKWFPDGVVGNWAASSKKFTWFPHVSGLRGSVRFIGLDDEKDSSKLASREYAGMAMDEPSPTAGTGGIDEVVFTTALSRLRQSGMNWYAAKLAQNNPDEGHWTYQKFVAPGTPGYTHFQTRDRENLKNLPPGYYESMEKDFQGRPDLVRRFVHGKHGFQQLGKPVCSTWNDDIHLAEKLEPVPGIPLEIGWDGGLTPVCVITQVHPDGTWLILDAIAEQDGGIYQLIEDQVEPLLKSRYAAWNGNWRHIGDPALESRDQSDSRQSPVKVLKKRLGGRWRAGAREIDPGVNPLNRRLALIGAHGLGMVRVDKERAKLVHYAFRGGWHYPKRPGGQVGSSPVKNHPDSDVGDACRYIASVLFPEGQVRDPRRRIRQAGRARYNRPVSGFAHPLRKGNRIPEEMREIP